MRDKKKWSKCACVFLIVLFAISICISAMASERLGETERAYWDSSELGLARWKKVEHAQEYQVRLYIGGGEYVKTITVESTKADFTSYIENDNLYYFTVRAVAKSSQKDYVSGEWVMSEELEVHNLGDTEGRWRTYLQGKKYQKEDGNFVMGQWYQIANDWYYFNQEGYAQTGWQQIDSKWYYLDEMGIMQTGWLKLNEDWYYLDSDGAMATGWKQVKPSEWYYLDSNGKMLANVEVDGCRLNESGLWVQ